MNDKNRSQALNTLLIIDDEPTLRLLLSRILELEGYAVYQAKDRMSGLDLLRHHDIDVVLCDVFLPDGNGVEMIPELKRCSPRSMVILLTAHGNISDGVQAIKNGAFDDIVKGDDNHKIIPIVSRAMDVLRQESPSRPTPPAVSPQQGFTAVVGQSVALAESIRMAQKVAVTDVCVLLNGETGTGKEVFARAIHEASPRKDRPFVAVNCSAFSRELLESELFGHKAGSFTGAVKDKKGLFEEAHGGTLFLDEVGEMEFCLQAKLLRVLESGEFIKVGDTKTTRVDVRIIAATNRDLKKEIANHQFREDLYFRLSVFQIILPPLRQRQGDIALLAAHFVDRFCAQMQRPGITLDPAAVRMMEAYPWPGNIRELKNVVERALIVCSDTITVDDLPVDLRLSPATAAPEADFDLATVERNHIAKILEYTHGNKTETARLLKIGLATLYRKIEAYHIQTK